MVTLHEVITFLVSMQISISSLQTHNVNRCGRSRHLARKLSLRRKRSSPNVFEMAATETITSIILIKLDLVIGKILTSRLSLSKHLAHNLGNLLLLGKIGVFHNRRNASSRLLLLISKHLILCIYLVFRILA